MRRRPTSGLWTLFIFFFFFGFADTFLPMLLMLGAIGYLMYKAVKASETNVHTSASATSRKKTVKQYGMTDNKHSADKKARVNAYLQKRFKNARTISLSSGTHNIVLTQNGSGFTNMDSLTVDCDGHSFKTVAYFRRDYGELYDQMFDTLLNMAQNDVAVNNSEIIDVEYSDRDDLNEREEAPVQQKTETKEPTTAEEFRDVINSLNDSIPDEEISNGLFETSALLKQLSDLERAFPDQTGKLKKLYTNYLPYLTGILKQYTKMQNVQTDPNYKKNEEALKNTINHINAAMKDRLIPAMSESDSINLQADMSTLEAMLRKDGMTSEDDIMSQLKKQQ